MTKIIEEKANKKYNNPVEPYCFETDNEEQWYRCGLRDGYIEGATEQRKIDIEKAEQFCIKWLEEIIALWLPDLRDETFHTKAVNEVKERLHKAMEE